jgi:hypothetical protein
MLHLLPPRNWNQEGEGRARGRRSLFPTAMSIAVKIKTPPKRKPGGAPTRKLKGHFFTTCFTVFDVLGVAEPPLTVVP